MKFKEGDKVEFIYRNKKGIGEINGVYPELREVTIKRSDSPVSLLFSDKAVAKVEEPERVVVPQFVADWISRCKQREYDLACLLDYVNTDMHGEMHGWLISSTDNQELLARAWLDGYKVEKEPLYYVKFVNDNEEYLNVSPSGRLVVANKDECLDHKTKFTEAEIKEMDERYWHFAVSVEDSEGEA
ncbi:DUF1642 domain-containing protein [Listeria monocytogenes]|nr:DUF1642 domain-containing protein [Listeria monocytogenes]EAD1148891.1 DUF1642 domain-containing protein [Listeria monocytogenes]